MESERRHRFWYKWQPIARNCEEGDEISQISAKPRSQRGLAPMVGSQRREAGYDDEIGCQFTFFTLAG
jgi:hypothetical protein